MFFVVKYANLGGFCCRRRRGCLSSLMLRQMIYLICWILFYLYSFLFPDLLLAESVFFLRSFHGKRLHLSFDLLYFVLSTFISMRRSREPCWIRVSSCHCHFYWKRLHLSPKFKKPTLISSTLFCFIYIPFSDKSTWSLLNSCSFLVLSFSRFTSLAKKNRTSILFFILFHLIPFSKKSTCSIHVPFLSLAVFILEDG